MVNIKSTGRGVGLAPTTRLFRITARSPDHHSRRDVEARQGDAGQQALIGESV